MTVKSPFILQISTQLFSILTMEVDKAEKQNGSAEETGQSTEEQPKLQHHASFAKDVSMEMADNGEESPGEIIIVDPDTELEGLEPLTRLERLYMRWNLIKKIENVSHLVTLRELELYDNQITVIENLDCLVNLESLDLSFNRIRQIQGLEALVNLQKLFLCSNKITQIENLAHLTKLQMLELGDNKIRVGHFYWQTMYRTTNFNFNIKCSFPCSNNVA
ncbi:hypothetical protein B566_EDAN005007 [Ephemera danica]|nr:hypothetical protein B566_EDAN005007 [Ephemera danica]